MISTVEYLLNPVRARISLSHFDGLIGVNAATSCGSEDGTEAREQVRPSVGAEMDA